MEEQQEIVFRLSMLEQQIQQLQQQFQAVERGINELESLNLGLDDLGEAKENEIFAQVGKGIYAKAKLVSKELIVNIGENIFVNKTIPQAKELINEQIKRLKEVKNELSDTVEATNTEFMEMIQKYQQTEESK